MSHYHHQPKLAKISVLLHVHPNPTIWVWTSQHRLPSRKTQAHCIQVKHFAFWSNWFKGREWLEYLCKANAAFCYPCRKFGSSNSNKAFTRSGYNNWKHAVDSCKGFGRHETGKDHIKCMTFWKKRQTRCVAGTDISSVVNWTAGQESSVSAIAAIIQFITANMLLLRGSVDGVEAKHDRSSGLFLSLMEYTLREDGH